jgi:MFS family permease
LAPKRLPKSLNVVLAISIIYSIAVQMATILVPLYAINLKMPPLSLAFLVSLPAVLQIVTRSFCGVINNYFGENRIMKVSFLCISVAGVAFIVSDTLLNLYIAQFLLSLSRGLFWSTAQTYISKLPEVEGRLNKVFGQLEGASAIGAIVGLILGGFLSQWFGFANAFIYLIISGAACFLMGNTLPEFPRSKSRQAIIAGISHLGEVIRYKPLYLAGMCAFIAAIPFGLVGSFYPVYFHSIGIQDGMIGVITSLKAAGTITAGLLVARFLDNIKPAISFGIGLALIGSTLILTQFFATPSMLALVVIFTGLGAGITSILYQSLTIRFSTDDNRSSAMAFTTNFWSLSNLVTPVMFGIFIQYAGLSHSFIIAGSLILAFGFFGILAFRRLAPPT